jgi:NAD(P)-dependent dehydrogenase (short-subunit alcohol dehydrogenase family)
MARNGIPIRFAHPILARGDKVIATSRKLEKVQHLEQAGAAVLPLDVTDSQQSIHQTLSKAIELFGRIDVLVNNAAYIQVGTFKDLQDVSKRSC